jgi:hypothetical protein
VEKRQAVPRDKLVLIKFEGRRILVPQKGERVEVVVGNGAVTEVEYEKGEWKWFFIHQTITMFEEAVFFYKEKGEPPEIWISSDKNRILSLKKLPLGTKFSVTSHRRTFKSIEDLLFGKFWIIADEPPGLEPRDYS